jgi:hypothetical protein
LSTAGKLERCDEVLESRSDSYLDGKYRVWYHMHQPWVAGGVAMTTVIKIEGDSPYALPHVDHISAIAHGENVDLTMYVALPGHADLEQVYVQLSLPAADDLLAQLTRAVAETAKDS